MAKNVYTKNEFRWYTNKKHLSKNNKPHPAYISLSSGNRFLFNVVTHSNSFFNKPTISFKNNPDRFASKNGKISNYSIPKWETKNSFSKNVLPKKRWNLSKEDYRRIRNFNRKYK